MMEKLEIESKVEKLEEEAPWLDVPDKKNELCRPPAVKLRMTRSQESTITTETGKDSFVDKRPPLSAKLKEGRSERRFLISSKNLRKNSLSAILKARPLEAKKNNREFRKFKAKFNFTLGNIMKDWMSLIYCTLILRANLIKFTLEQLSDSTESDANLRQQILLESKIIYGLIREAQNYSQKKFLFMWVEFEKLMSNCIVLKNALETMKDPGLHDWKIASAKLAQLQNEFKKAESAYKIVQKSKNEVENEVKENVSALERLSRSKSLEHDQLVEQITELKKKEAQMRGKILLNMKSYKDLRTKRQNLLSVVNEINQLKNDQNVLLKEYSLKIQSLKSQIEEKEKQINVEKEEKKKIKVKLENFGHFSRKSSLQND